MNRRLATDLLTLYGCTVMDAPNGRVALDMLGIPFDDTQHCPLSPRESRPFNYDLVCMDCLMPIMDGYETIRHIREYETTMNEMDSGVRSIPVVAMTACAVTGDMDQCLRMGMDDYLAKPICKKSVLHMLSKHCADLAEIPIAMERGPAEKEQYDEAVVCDWAWALNSMNDNEPLAVELVDIVLAEGPDRARRMRVMLNERNHYELGFYAHKMAGAVGMLGGWKLLGLCQRIECSAHADEQDKCIEFMQQFDGCYDEFMQAIRVHTSDAACETT